MPNSIELAQNIESILVPLRRTPVKLLRQRWRELFGTEPPAAFGPDLLRRAVAQRLQEDAYGKLSVAAQRELNRFIALLEKSPAGQLEPRRRIKVGAVLVRDWKSKSHRVTVLDDGFEYDGHPYASLSEIARDITGTRWNGPRFFGLRVTERAKPEALQDPDGANGATGRSRGRPRKPATAISQGDPTPAARHGV